MATFKTSPPAILDAWMRLLNEHGVRSFWLYDLLYNIDHILRLAGIAKEYGSEVAASIMFGESPVHTDEYFAEKTRLPGRFARRRHHTALRYCRCVVQKKDDNITPRH